MRAASTASAVGALTATSARKPAAHAFWTISIEARPLTNSPSGCVGGSPPSSSSAPTTLSTALCRPTSSRVDDDLAVGVERGRGVDRAGRVEQALAGRHAVGIEASTSSGIASPAGSGWSRAVRASIWSLPHQPQLDDVVPSRGVAFGAWSPVSTVTTLNSLATADPLAQYRTPVTGARRAALR